MGAYVYTVRAERVRLTDGREANLAQYAYKPSWSDHKWNARMDARYSTPARKLAAEGKLTGLVVMDKRPGAPVFEYRYSTFIDDTFKGKRLAGVGVANPKSKSQFLWLVSYVNTASTIISGPDAGRHPVETMQIPADSYYDATRVVLEQDDRYMPLPQGSTLKTVAKAGTVETIVPAKAAEKPLYTTFDWE